MGEDDYFLKARVLLGMDLQLMYTLAEIQLAICTLAS